MIGGVGLAVWGWGGHLDRRQPAFPAPPPVKMSENNTTCDSHGLKRNISCLALLAA